MDVMSPELMWIDGRCYRVPLLDSAISGCDIGAFKDRDLDWEADNVVDKQDEEGEDCLSDMPDINQVSYGKWKTIFPVSRSFMPFIIGSKGATVKRISKDTSCAIITPRINEKQDITIYGPTREKIILALKTISFIINSSRRKLLVTHLVSIPLNSNEIQENYNKFKEDILLSINARGICNELFQDPEKLHITIAALILTDDKERKVAAEKFSEICENMIRPILDNVKPCTLEMQGVDIMNDDPSNVRILYANVKIKDHDGLLEEICDNIFDALKVLDFCKVARDKVKIHATLMKTSKLDKVYGEGITEDSVPQANFTRRNNEPFDATDIINKYKNYYFGKLELNSIHLSIRFSHDETGYYKYITKMDI